MKTAERRVKQEMRHQVSAAVLYHCHHLQDHQQEYNHCFGGCCGGSGGGGGGDCGESSSGSS